MNKRERMSRLSRDKSINELIAHYTERNAKGLKYMESGSNLDYGRFNILIRNAEDYTRFKDELSTLYKIVEFDASEIVFYKITSLQGGEFCRISNGPGTKYTVIRESEFDSYCSIEKPVLYYHSGSFTSEINRCFRSVFEQENTLIVIKNLDKIENSGNRSVFLRFIWNDEDLPPKPVIVLLENADNRIFLEVCADAKDRYYIL